MNKYFQMQKDVLLDNNPTFVQFLGLCPTLAVTVLFSGALWMGLSVIVVLVFSNMFVSIFKNVIPQSVRIPVYTTIIATLVTMIIMILETFAPAVYTQLGIYLPLIVVNCLVLGRAEAFASKNKVGVSMLDGLATGVAFTVSLAVIAFIRELFGTGQVALLHISIMQSSEAPFIFQTGAGAFFTLGLLAWIFNDWKMKREKKLKAMNRSVR